MTVRDVRTVRRRMAGGRVLALTGAGVSAESGIPTFRGEDGWWNREDPSKLATQAAFDRDPAYVWEWYEFRRGLVGDARPNAGHRALATLGAREGELLVATQNVDDLHERAGSDPVTHVHGSIWRVRCQACGREREDRRHPLPKRPPRCETCGGLERPAVVWFGERLPGEPIRRVESFIAGGVDAALVIGTEASFGYIQGFARAARRAGGLLVEVNPSRTVLSDVVDIRLAGPAGEVLPELVRAED
ncbi:MAG: NAD-dependent protein deacylase [Longimicrobiales bacterium]|nr:NAD-dependent protein deacylase [Longimicrobiales bacterium]